MILGTKIPLTLSANLWIGAFVFGKKTTENENTTTEENLITETETTISGEIIQAGLADIGELATEEYYFTEVETYDSTKTFMDFNLPFTTTRFVYSYDGVIKAGIDFTGIEVEKDDLLKTITIRLPKSKILSSEIDESSFQVYDEEQSIFNKVSISFPNEIAQLALHCHLCLMKRSPTGFLFFIAVC